MSIPARGVHRRCRVVDRWLTNARVILRGSAAVSECQCDLVYRLGNIDGPCGNANRAITSRTEIISVSNCSTACYLTCYFCDSQYFWLGGYFGVYKCGLLLSWP
jgi:hypothetical protein